MENNDALVALDRWLALLNNIDGLANNSKPLLLRADFVDLLESNELLKRLIFRSAVMTNDFESIESLLIDIEVRYIDHVQFHLNSLRRNVKVLLDKVAQNIIDSE